MSENIMNTNCLSKHFLVTALTLSSLFSCASQATDTYIKALKEALHNPSGLTHE
jgi:hypothetical protein